MEQKALKCTYSKFTKQPLFSHSRLLVYLMMMMKEIKLPLRIWTVMLAGFAFDGKHVYNPLSFDFARWIRRYEVVMSLFSVITDMPPLLLSKLTSYNIFYDYYDDYIYFIQCTHNIGPLGEFCQNFSWIEIILTINAVLLKLWLIAC